MQCINKLYLSTIETWTVIIWTPSRQAQVGEVPSLPLGETVVSTRGAQDPIMGRIDSLDRNDLGAYPWWRHEMEPFSTLLAICAGNSPVPGEFPSQRPVTRNGDVFFDLRLNKRLSKQREAGDLRRYSAHYDVNIMQPDILHTSHIILIIAMIMSPLWYLLILRIDGSVQDCSNSNALETELLQSCAKPRIYCKQIKPRRDGCFSLKHKFFRTFWFWYFKSKTSLVPF